jgi:hypothetical protein
MTTRPQFVLFGSSIVQFNHYGEGWGATLAHLYARKVGTLSSSSNCWDSHSVTPYDHIFS